MGQQFDLGVLLVHGIGGQKRGDTLRAFGEPLVRSLVQWLRDDEIEVTDTTLLQGPADAPAHTCVAVGRGNRKKRVLVAESWWAEAFEPPSWWAFAGWLVWGIPFVIFRAADHGISVIDTNEKLDDARASHRLRRWLGVPWYIGVRLIKNVLSVVIALVAVAVLSVVGILALVPRLRVTILSGQRVLIRYLGDSYCLLRDPLCADAVVSQVERDLDWLETHAGPNVAVLAHSQGAELALRAIRRRDAGAPIASLITVGSGIAKLRAVERLHTRRWRALGAYALRTLAAALTVGGIVVAVLADVSSWPVDIAAVASVVAAALLITRARRALQKIVQADKLADDLSIAVGTDKVRRWLDIYSTSDPVPEGALPVERLGFPASSIRIANYRSAVRDHGAYGRNGEAFGPAVLAELARLIAWKPPPAAMVVVHNSRERRAAKALALVTDRIAIAGAAVAAVLLPYVFDVERERAEDIINWLEPRAEWTVRWLGMDVERWIAGEPGRYVIGAAALALGAGALYGIGVAAWMLAARRRERRLFHPSRPAGAEPLGEIRPRLLSFAYGRIAKHADKIDSTYGWAAHPRRLRKVLPRLRGAAVLVGLRHGLRQQNLYDAVAADPPGRVKFTARTLARTPDGAATDVSEREMGAAGEHFGRNGPAFPARPDLPPAKRVSDELLARRDGELLPAERLNLLAAAWVQFEVHDWMQHKVRPDAAPARFRAIRRSARGEEPFERTPDDRPGAPRFISAQTHWWDASQLYGVDPKFTASLRDDDGRIKTGRHLLESIEASMKQRPSPVPNLWLGLALFHEIFAREHNAICDLLAVAEPNLRGDALFEKARLINAAVMAKVHTVEWTPAVVAHPTTAHAILATWWGVLGPRTRRLVGRIGRGEVLSGIPGSRTHHDGVRYSLTEEFVAVYRMHPLIPDRVTFRAVEDRRRVAEVPFADLTVAAGPASWPRDWPEKVGYADAFYSLAIACPGRITLHNYPEFLRRLPVPEGGHVDLAERDIERMREAALPSYNDFRRIFRMPPKQSFVEMTGGDERLAAEIEAVYGDLESVDLMVGLFAEPPPEGFAFSDSAFRIFLLMAARRLRSDRFFTTDFTPAVYTRAGYKWVQRRTMKQMLAEHFPALLPALEGVDNVFKPWHPLA